MRYLIFIFLTFFSISSYAQLQIICGFKTLEGEVLHSDIVDTHPKALSSYFFSDAPNVADHFYLGVVSYRVINNEPHLKVWISEKFEVSIGEALVPIVLENDKSHLELVIKRKVVFFCES